MTVKTNDETKDDIFLKDIIGKKVMFGVVTRDKWIDYIHEIAITFEDGTKLTVTQNDEDRWNYGDTWLGIEVTK